MFSKTTTHTYTQQHTSVYDITVLSASVYTASECAVFKIITEPLPSSVPNIIFLFLSCVLLSIPFVIPRLLFIKYVCIGVYCTIYLSFQHIYGTKIHKHFIRLFVDLWVQLGRGMGHICCSCCMILFKTYS